MSFISPLLNIKNRNDMIKVVSARECFCRWFKHQSSGNAEGKKIIRKIAANILKNISIHANQNSGRLFKKFAEFFMYVFMCVGVNIFYDNL